MKRRRQESICRAMYTATVIAIPRDVHSNSYSYICQEALDTAKRRADALAERLKTDFEKLAIQNMVSLCVVRY